MSLTDQAELGGVAERVEKLHALINARGPDVSFDELAEVSGLPAAKIREIATDLFREAAEQGGEYE